MMIAVNLVYLVTFGVVGRLQLVAVVAALERLAVGSVAVSAVVVGHFGGIEIIQLPYVHIHT